MAPSNLTARDHSLPLMLHGPYRNSKLGYSKAPRGLSVLMQVIRVFTDIPISPSPSSRQHFYHYAFRAGRNLPDKEFRYLRTVIVTAAVHRGFSYQLCRNLLTNFFNLPALGRRQPPYVILRISGDLCFW